ncbi:MAG: SHOCT domain-containing protein [Pseudoclavibacter sp.]
MDYWSNFWNIIWYGFTFFVFIAYIMVIFSIFSDIFRDHLLKGWHKALWIVFILVFQVVGPLVYLIVRGAGMGQRQAQAIKAAQEAQENYIRDVALASPADEIAKAKALLDSGAITQSEYEALKAKHINA